MFHYLFTNDLRITDLESSLKDAGNCFVNNSIPKDKAKNNNVNTLGFYFNLTPLSNCAKEASKGNIRKVVINFIRKFQFPNPRTRESLENSLADNISFAPLRTIFKTLWMMNIIDSSKAYLSDYEIAKYLFFSEDVAKRQSIDFVSLCNTIMSNHAVDDAFSIPDDSVLQAKGYFWNQCKRQIREMVKVIVWSGCAIKDQNGFLRLKNESLSREEEADLFEILGYNQFWTPNSNDFSKNEDSYQQYFDLPDEENGDAITNTTGLCNLNFASNLIIYGTPGCGKSYYVDNVLLNELGLVPDANGDVFRTTFYPDYSNTDFVGQIIPKTDGTNVTYEMMPGPFTLALEKAYRNLDANTNPEPVVLVIEELNRGNAAAIFGDIFQLLDRDEKGNSRYHIKNQYIQAYLNKAFEDEGKTFGDIYIPSNLYLISTMNTSDQNVFKLDNAFKRRWSFQKMKNFFDASHPYKNYFVPGMDDRKITWEALVNTINNYMLDLGAEGEITAEDKQIGVYFLDKESLIDPATASTLSADDKAKKEQKFESKTLEYLWDDVAKYDPTQWFRKDIHSLDELIDKYPTEGEKVFADDFRRKLEENLEAMAKGSEEQPSSVETSEEGGNNGENGSDSGEAE